MCGIAGWIGPHECRSGTVDRQLETLMHRGPDAAAVSVDAGASIGQTRLAVIDLETGDPPIRNEDRTVSVALNGEIYNYRELREDLLRAGHVFATQGDTEVIAHLAEECAPTELARRVDGMFAFAVWDVRKRRLVLARDRVGKKPLYYFFDGRTLVFGSEIKSILAHPAVPRELEPSAISAYLTFGYVPTPRTFFRGILSVPPGHVLVLDDGGAPAIRSYWDPPLAGDGTAPHPGSLADQARDVRCLLREAVGRRLISDVPLGAFLSGGIDSSAVVGLMAEQMDEPVRTFTIGFDDQEGFDERPYAEQIARRFRTEHTTFEVQPPAVDLIERLVWHHDQPFGDSSAIPTFLLSELTKGHVTVALSGDGGDELFAGYERFAAAMLLSRYERIPRRGRRAVSAGVGQLPAGLAGGRVGRGQRFLNRADEGMPDALRSWISIFAEPDRLRLLGDRADGWALADYRAGWDRTAGAPDLDRMLHVNLRTYLLDDLLPKVDRMSMAHGLEVRSPFLDTRLVEHAMRVPGHHKLRGLSLKRVLKSAVADLLPAALLKRRKRGFGVPLDRWFRSDLETYVHSMLGGPNACIRRHMDGSGIDQLLAEHACGARNRGHQLWTLLTLEVFLRREGW
ncbi:MAG: asparagine synthase (glutamine-hydrolyzing) [Solirubrobacteraceae bacterium]